MSHQIQRLPPSLPDHTCVLPRPLPSHRSRATTDARRKGHLFYPRPPPHRLALHGHAPPHQQPAHPHIATPMALTQAIHPGQNWPGPQSDFNHTHFLPPAGHRGFFPPPPPGMPFQLMAPPSENMPTAPQLSPEELAIKPRPHPHLPGNVLYISHVPGGLPEDILAQLLVDCMPVRIKLDPAVPAEFRSPLDTYYDWMPKSGTLEFDDTYNVEKAMAILSSYPLLAARDTMISPYPPPSPLPFGESRGRYVRPTQRLAPLAPSIDPFANLMASCPSPADLFDVVRGWGSVRDMSIWAEPLGAPTTWAARIGFWYEDEARRFEIGFGQCGGHVKGWQVEIISDALPTEAVPVLPHHPPPPPISQIASGSYKFCPHTGLDAPQSQFMLNPADPAVGPYPSLSSPQTPPLNSQLQWSSHHPYTVNGLDLPYIPPGAIQVPFPLSPPMGSFGLPSTPSTPNREDPGFRPRHGNRASLSRDSMSSLRSFTGRKWSVTLDQGPDGEMRPSGLVADDGMVIQHGPGQHIRPAPPFGPGSTSVSGLVDYSNVFVKNLDPDINSDFLFQLFSSVGRIVSARVMRDHMNRSRGYGFVSFHTPAEGKTASAIEHLDGAKIGGQSIAVTLHEPKKLRPEKLMDRRSLPAPTAYGRPGRRSTSPSSIRRGRQPSDEPKPVATMDKIRSLSPASRKVALVERVTPVVRRYLKVHKLSEGYCAPVVTALASQDLALIPALHNHILFTNKIAETVTELQDDPAAQSESGEIVEHAHPPTQDEIELIRLGIKMIDPVNVEEILQIMIPDLAVEDIKRVIEDRTQLTIRYHAAKKKLMGQVSPPDDEHDHLPRPESVPLPPSDASTMVDEIMDVDVASLGSLARLPTQEIVAPIRAGGGEGMLVKLGAKQLSPGAIALLRDQKSNLIRMKGEARKTETVKALARLIECNTKSAKLESAREMIDAEMDEDALWGLMAYPEILNAKCEAMAQVGQP